MKADQSAQESSLIWVHIVCNIGYLSILAGEKSDDQRRLAGKMILM